MTRLTLVPIVLAAFSSTAHAQDAVVEGPGVQVGDSTILHPSVLVATGVIHNLFYEENSARTTGVLRLIGDLEFSPAVPDSEPDALTGERTPSSQSRIDLRGGLTLTYEEYLSGSETVRSQRNLGIGTDISFVAFPQGKFSFYAKDRFLRAIRPVNFESSEQVNRDINHVNTGVQFRPGGGAMTFAARYENRIEFFEDEDQRFANRIWHTIGAGADWRWLPMTKFYFDASYGFYGGFGDEAQMVKNSSRPLNIQLGAASLITPLTTIRAHAGFLWTDYEGAGEDYMGPTAGAEIGYRYLPFGRVVGAYNFTVQDSINADLYLEHSAKLTLAQQVNRLVFGVEGEARFRTYRGIPLNIMAITGGDRSDVILAARASASYVLLEWLAAFAEYQLVSDQTDFQYTIAPGEIDDPSYVRQEIFLGARGAF